MIEISITRTAKNIGSKDGYSLFSEDSKRFRNMAEAKDFLKEEYGNCKRQLMYRDDKNGNAVRSGYIYCFKNADWSHAPVEHWYQQDWVSFYKVTEITV